MKRKVLVLGKVNSVIKSLRAAGHEVYLWEEVQNSLYKSPQIKWDEKNKVKIKSWLKKSHFLPDVVIASKEKTVMLAQRVREILKINIHSSQTIQWCHHKLRMKTHLKKNKILMTDFVAGKKGMDLKRLAAKWGDPLVLKELTSSGSRGMKIIYASDLNKQIDCSDKIIEKYIDAREYSVESFIQSGRILFSNITQYYTKAHVNIVPANLPQNIEKKILDFNKKIIRLCKIKQGMTHLEIYLKEDKIYFGEIALRPPGGQIMELLSYVYQKNFWDIFVSVECGEKINLKNLSSHRYAAVFIFHPGEGEVERIEGEAHLKKLKSYKKHLVKVSKGQRVSKRQGLGQNVGHIFLVSNNWEKLISDLEKIKQQFKIHLIS